MKIKYVIAIVIIASLIIIGVISFWSNTTIKNSKSTGTNIIAFGDSLVYGVGSTEGNDMFSLVSKEVGVPIINKGVPGNTTFDGLERLDNDVLSQDPKIVFVLLGGNDYLQKIPKETTFQNLSTIIEKIQDRGAAVILLGVRGGIVDRFGDDYKALSEKYQTGYIPDVLEGLFINREYMFDTIHPNDKGYRIISLRIIPVLKNILEQQ